MTINYIPDVLSEFDCEMISRYCKYIRINKCLEYMDHNQIDFVDMMEYIKGETSIQTIL